MILNIKFQDDFFSESIKKHKYIPCICKISGEIFTIEFVPPLRSAVGRVGDFYLNDINERYPAGGGGEYTHYCFGEISLDMISEDDYNISDLRLFSRLNGWVNILEDSRLSDIIRPEDRYYPDWARELDKDRK
ncbi:hypothetical protein [Delftia tsuruhatensis]|uniref:hypothetical protein n=1 Tax=Delftia tsuruhatensis TaxID=180282 RepID=UPI0028A6DC94|nr:hypothetical protein [Delftia tsuruhatensis]